MHTILTQMENCMHDCQTQLNEIHKTVGSSLASTIPHRSPSCIQSIRHNLMNSINDFMTIAIKFVFQLESSIEQEMFNAIFRTQIHNIRDALYD